jgi:hypothetical protein
MVIKNNDDPVDTDNCYQHNGIIGKHHYILWMEEILHQLIGGKHPINSRVLKCFKPSKIPLVAQDFATTQRMT